MWKKPDRTNEVNKEFIMPLLVPSVIASNELFNGLSLPACFYLELFFFFFCFFCINSSSVLLEIIAEKI